MHTHRSPLCLSSRKLKVVTLLALSLVTAACGGGGSDSDDQNFAGTWRGALTRTETCGGASNDQTISFTHSVNQNGDAITLNDGAGLEYLGNTVADDGFSVDAVGQTGIGEAQCPTANRIEYHDVNDDDDSTANVEFSITPDCAEANGCRVAYTGSASRNSAAPTATPAGTPPSTTTPIAGGCPAMNQNPAAGTYAGDGGCGISTAAFSVSSQADASVVILEPFGVNGATSFVINGANPASASSTRTDLTINGEAGYSCTLACTPPGTFTAACFKEGATQCAEKF